MTDPTPANQPPDHGDLVLIYCADVEWTLGYWDAGESAWYSSSDLRLPPGEPTHWMPLPPAPKEHAE